MMSVHVDEPEYGKENHRQGDSKGFQKLGES